MKDHWQSVCFDLQQKFILNCTLCSPLEKRGCGDNMYSLALNLCHQCQYYATMFERARTCSLTARARSL